MRNPYYLLNSNEGSKVVICDPTTGKIYKGNEIKKGAPENQKDPSIVWEFDFSKVVHFERKSGRVKDSEIKNEVLMLGLSEEEKKRVDVAKDNYFKGTVRQPKNKISPYYYAYYS
jgi:hypothetical protein